MRKLIAVLLSALILLLWPVFRRAAAGPEVTLVAGDVNGDGGLDISDPIFLLRHIFADGPPPVSAQAPDVEARIARLEERALTDEQREMLGFMSMGETETVTGGDRVPAIVFTGVNVQIVNGLGATNGTPELPLDTSLGACETNGTGNLILGYQELRGRLEDGKPRDFRGGSHNLVIGGFNNYTEAGGIVAGHWNTIGGPYASVTAGKFNDAVGELSVVSGGMSNGAYGAQSAISGGCANFIGDDSGCGSVSGGIGNTVQGLASTVSGGWRNIAAFDYSTVSAGIENRAQAVGSTVSGGLRNFANAPNATISGGVDLTLDVEGGHAP